MPMVVYTEEEVIEKCNAAEAEGASRAADQRDRAMQENTLLRRQINEYRDAMVKAKDILTRNLGHQTEKCYDALAYLRLALKGYPSF